MNKYDAIVIGAGHNGLTNAAYLAKAGLKVAVLERNPHIGGATVSRELYEGWYYSNCSYVSSLLRPEVTRDLELPRHGLQVVPFGGGATFMQNHSPYRLGQVWYLQFVDAVEQLWQRFVFQIAQPIKLV